VEGTGLEGASTVYSSIRVIHLVAKQMWEQQQPGLEALSPQELAAVEGSLAVLEESCTLARLYMLSRKNVNQLFAFIRKFRDRLEDLAVGGTLIVPGAFTLKKSFNPFALVLERTKEDAFQVTVVNTTHGSAEFHISSPTSAPPKIQTRFTMSFSNVPRDKVVDDAWWFMFFRMGFSPADFNTADKFYNDLLPLLLGLPLDTAMLEARCDLDDTVSPLRTNERANLSGYRCVREAWMYYLNRHGVTSRHSGQVYLNYQRQWLKMLLNDLHLVNTVTESDLQLIRLSTKQMAHRATRKLKKSDLPSFLPEQLLDIDDSAKGVEERIKRLNVMSYGAATRALSLRTQSIAAALSTLFVGQGGEVVSADSFRGKNVAVYFSAHWCGPCREFTPVLAELFNRLTGSGKQWQIVFVSMDRSAEAFEEYFATMPWIAVPYSDTARRQTLSELFDPQGIPSLFMLDANLEIINSQARQAIMQDSDGVGFPWDTTTAGLAAAAAARIAKRDCEHTTFERFLRLEDVNGLAGPAITNPGYVPIDFLLLPERATTFAEGLAALRWADKLCTLLSVQVRHVKNPWFMKAALIQHVFTKIVPVPKSDSSPDCIWSVPVLYAQQLDITLLLKRLMEHFAASVYAIRATKEFDAVKIVVSAAMTTLADCLLRKIATDIPSEVSSAWNKHQFGIKVSPFDEQSETILVTMPELNITRTDVLDYWAGLSIPEERCIFNFNDTLACDESTSNFVNLVCSEMGFPHSPEHTPRYVTGEQWYVVKNFPEFEFFRDIVFHFKFFLGTDKKAKPPIAPHSQKDAELRWQFQQGQFIVAAFRMQLTCAAKGHRWPSFAIANRFTQPRQAQNEDDILHIKELPDFDKCLGQRDSELLLSALTTPYLRIPIVVSFFATEDRVHALKSETLQHLLDSVVFEPSRYLPKDAATAPVFVPAKDETLLNTPYGLLLNELARSPHQVMKATITLLKLALSLDTGSYFASQSDIILYLVRFACRIENFVDFVLQYADGKLHKAFRMRDTVVDAGIVAYLREARAELRTLLEGRCQYMLLVWTRECLARADALQEENKHEHQRRAEAAAVQGEPVLGAAARKKFKKVFDESKRESASDFDRLFAIVSDLRAHVILCFRNCPPDSWTIEKVRRFSSFFTFLSTRHTWNANLLSFPEPELFEVYQNCRRDIIHFVQNLSLPATNDFMESITSLVADSEQLAIARGWGVYKSISTLDVPDSRQQGRYGVCESSAKCALLSGTNPHRAVSVIDESRPMTDMGVEINLQLSQLSLKSNHLEALNQPMSSDYDVVTIFGVRSLQVAVVEKAQHRQWYRMIGRQHDLEYWDADTRTDVQEWDRDYDPGDMLPSETWIAQLFEPIRLSYYVPPAVQEPIPFVLPERVTSPDDDIAVLIGLHPAEGGNIIEVVLCKSLQCVNIYLVESFGRRFWRTQCYASDARFSLRFLQPSWEDRRSMWPQWGRYEAGKATLPQPIPSSVITREATLADNLAGTAEMFVPARYLYGVLPAALLDGHDYWLDDNDTLRGYPRARDEKTELYEYVLFVTIDKTSKRATVAKRFLTAVRAEWTDAELAHLGMLSETTEEETGLHNEKGSRKRPTKSSRELDRGTYSEADELFLQDVFYADKNSKLRRAARCLARVEALSHMLFWNRGENDAAAELHLVELPRLRISLREQNGRLFSVDHADLFICDEEYLSQRPEIVKLVQGIPHSLVLVNSNDEPNVLLPLDRPARPAIQSSPFTTELVQDRINWGSLATRYLLLPIHVSLSFIRTPTLASALYLLLLRLLSRNYQDVLRLVPSVGSDSELTGEESAVLREIAAVKDAHPDAHATRMHLTMALIDAPQGVKGMLAWDVPNEIYKYLSKLSYVSMFSLLDVEQELTCIQLALDQIAKEMVIKRMLQRWDEKVIKRFMAYLFDPEAAEEISFTEKQRFDGMLEQIQTAIEEDLGLDPDSVSHEEIKQLIPKLQLVRTDMMKGTLRNRRAWLQTAVGQPVVLELPTRNQTTNWQWWFDDTALTSSEGAWSEVEMQYDRVSPRGPLLFKSASAIMGYNEGMTGDPSHHGFLFLYEAFTGSIRCKVGAHDDSFTMARLLWHYYDGAHKRGSVWSSVLSLIASNPMLLEMLPHFRDTRRVKVPVLLGKKTDEQPDCPLDNLMQDLIPILESLAGTDYITPPLDVSSLPKLQPPSADERTVVVYSTVNDDRALRRPKISNFMCDSRRLLLPDLELLLQLAQHSRSPGVRLSEQQLRSSLAADEATLKSISGQPLAGLGLDQFVTSAAIAESERVSLSMPFDVSAHPEAHTPVAVQMTARLHADLKNYEDQLNAKVRTRLTVDLRSNDVSVVDKLALLKDLEARALVQRADDLRYVQAAFSLLNTCGNYIPQGEGVDTQLAVASSTTSLDFSLSRYAGQETWLLVDYIVGALTSTEAVTDLSKVNPFLDVTHSQEILTLAALAIARATRIGQVNRVLSQCRKIVTLLGDPAAHVELTEGAKVRLMQQEETLVRELTAERHYVNAEDGAFDPRFLVFEFVWNIMLFKAQLEMVREFKHTVDGGGSLVRQLIMGSGKTTCVSPLLCLMLADKKHLVVEAVPPALLEFSRSVLRSSFSSILQKRVYTFTFDRSSIMSEATLKKLRTARDDAGVVMTTPTAIKALLLRYIENLFILRNKSTNASLAKSRRYERFLANQGKLVEALRLLVEQGILLCDEIDLLLHPLRSELNFPVGEKFGLDFAPARWTYPMFILNILLCANGCVGLATDVASTAIGESVPLAKESKRVLEQTLLLVEALKTGYGQRALQRVPHMVLLDDGFYATSLRPIFVELTVCWLEQQHFDPAVLQGRPIREVLVNKYLMPPPPEDAGEDNEFQKYMKQINMCHDWLVSFFPHAMKKIDRVTFGTMNEEDRIKAMEIDPMMPRTRWKLAIPFVSKDVPSRSSEFAHPDVVISLTFLAYRYQGLRYEDFEEVISELRAQLTKEVGPMRERTAYKLYHQFVTRAGGVIKRTNIHTNAEEVFDAEAEENDREVVPLNLLKRSDDEQMQKLFEVLKQSTQVVDYYLQEMVFPTFLRYQTMKLSASGQEIGGEIMFKRRIGFSGTPSSLLPLEMGETQFEKGSDGLMLTAMTDPEIVSLAVVEDDWSPTSVLLKIAKQPEADKYSALIDTGALITGMTNVEVATFLLDNGLKWCDGVVFLDDNDRKMVLVRATRRVVELDQCGIQAGKLFALYDQVHTTGTDLPFLSTFNAKAVQTVGKDMVWRDFVQGAWRMRRLQRGHTIHIFVIPEVYELMGRELDQAQSKHLLAPDVDSPARLCALCAWLVINAMRSEKLQFQALQMQNAANVWRKNAFQVLLKGEQSVRAAAAAIEGPSTGDGGDDVLQKIGAKDAVQCFKEPIDFNIADSIVEGRDLTTVIADLVADHKDFVVSREDMMVIQRIKKLSAVIAPIAPIQEGESDIDRAARLEALRAAARNDSALEIALQAQMIQEAEQEQEQEQEQEKEREVEIEKFVDLQYSRDMEEPVHWRFDDVIRQSPCRNVEDVNDETAPFYEAKTFRLYKRNPIEFPACIAISSNYFNPRWSGERRLKNVVCVLEFVPQVTLLRTMSTMQVLRSISSADFMSEVSSPDFASAGSAGDGELDPVGRQLSVNSITTLEKAFALLDIKGEQQIDQALLNHVVHAAIDKPVSEWELEHIMAQFSDAEGHFTIDSLRDFLLSDHLRPQEDGRHYVALSMAEAETVRRIMHLRAGDIDVEMKLHVLPIGFSTIDCIVPSRERQLPIPEDDSAYQALVVHQALRFFDGELTYTEQDINVLLRALQGSSCNQRQLFFEQVMGCRRRLRRKWEATPLSKVFTLRSEFHLLQQRAQVIRMRLAILQRDLTYFEAFKLFDIDNNGLLSAGELWAALEFLGVPVTSSDVIDLMRTNDTDGDCNLGWGEFAQMLRWSDEELLRLDKQLMAASPQQVIRINVDEVVLVAKGEEELAGMWKSQDKEAARKAREELREYYAMEEARADALEKERDDADRAAGIKPNPDVSPGRLIFNFMQQRLPKKTEAFGSMDWQAQVDGSSSLRVEPRSYLVLPLHHLAPASTDGVHINEYTGEALASCLCVGFICACANRLPIASQSLTLLLVCRSRHGRSCHCQASGARRSHSHGEAYQLC